MDSLQEIKPCPFCGGAVTARWNKRAARRSQERHAALPRRHWDGTTPLYSDAADLFFFSEDELCFYLSEEGCNIELLRLVICKPVRLSEIESDYWIYDLPEDGELPPEVEEALEALNAKIRAAEPVSWEPGEFAAEIDAAMARG